MEEVKEMMGNKPVYLSFDIDAIDPGFCPGTGVFAVCTVQGDEETSVVYLLGGF